MNIESIDKKIDELAEMVQRGFQDVYKRFDVVDRKIEELRVELKTDMENGFDEVNRRISKGIQPQLDGHAHRIKEIEHHLSL